MRVVRFHVNPVVPKADAAVGVLRRVIDQPFRNRPRMMPHYSSGTCVERGGIVRGSHEHHSIRHYRSHLKPSRVARMKNPFRVQPHEIAWVDL
jgi:hypothetical protein